MAQLTCGNELRRRLEELNAPTYPPARWRGRRWGHHAQKSLVAVPR